MSPTLAIQDAIANSTTIREIYRQLRTRGDISNRTALLRQAEQYADSLGQQLQLIAQSKASILTNAEAACSLQELGNAMEALMVQEREYRISVGGEDTPTHKES